jgi:hypothetical protein
MSLFSERKGIKSVKSIIQIDFINEDLRNSLWNALTICYWSHFKDYRSASSSRKQELETFLLELWVYYFKKPIDVVSNHWFYNHKEIKEHFLTCEWYEVYDFIEFIANAYPNLSTNRKFIDICNKFLEREVSTYRFVGTKITEITSEAEIFEIEEALEDENSLKLVANHLKQALDLLADRKSPDYRNSIKESILAVEATCQLITGNPKATLGASTRRNREKSRYTSCFKKFI